MDHPLPPRGRNGSWFRFDHEGQRFLFWIDERPDALQDIIVRKSDFYEVEALQMIREVLPAKARIVDVGANIGNHAIYFDRVCGAEKVFVIEPNSDVVSDLKANAEANNCEAIDLSTIGFAAGAESGTGTLAISVIDDAIRNRGAFSVTQGQGARMAGQPVPIRRLDDLDLGRIDFLKIDVEGGALGVLNGAQALLSKWRPAIFVEVDVPDIPLFIGWIRDNDYDVSAAIEYHPGIVNLLLISGSKVARESVRMPARRADDAGKQWSALVAEQHRADRCEETLSVAIVAMRNADSRVTTAEERAQQLTADLRDASARATKAEGHSLQLVADLRDALARATKAEGHSLQLAANLREALARLEKAESLQAAHLAALNQAKVRRNLWQRLLFHASGKPRRAVRTLFYHSSGRPRGALKAHVVHPDGRPRDAFRRWMTSAEYRAMPDVAAGPPKRFLAREAQSAPRASPAPSRLRPGLKRVLFIDSDYPNPDHDSGSVDTINYVTWLSELGYEVVFLSTRYNADKRAEQPIVTAGARVLHLSGEKAVADYLRDEGPAFGLFFLSRVHCGGRFFETCRRCNPQGSIIFNTVDLHHVREGREAQLRQDREAMFRAQAVLDREIYLTRQSDLTIVVSSIEKDILAAAVPGAAIGVMPLVRRLPAAIPGFEFRSGIGFVGGYAHVPNVDAVRYFLQAVWPHVYVADAGIHCELAGAGLPDDITRALPPGVMYKGRVPDLEGWLGGLRLTVAPLRYGAGAKGKVASSIVNGVPVVGTRIAFEGMGLGPDATVTADDPADMAREIVRIHSDSIAWNSLSQGAQVFATANLSPSAGRARFATLLSTLPGASATMHSPLVHE